MKQVQYSKVVMRKLQTLKSKLCVEFGDEVSKEKITHIVNALDNLSLSSNPGESIKERFGIETTYRYVVISPNIFILSISGDKLVIKQMFNEKEDFIYKLFKVKMRSNNSIKYWGE